MAKTQGLSSSAIVVRASERMGFVDLTDELVDAVAWSGVEDGFCLVFTTHTTCALMVNEWEDGAREDFVERLAALVPDDAYYAHDDLSRRTQNLVPDERSNGRSHVIHMLMGGTSQVIPVVEGRPAFGRWQRLILVELDEPKDRTILFQAFGSASSLRLRP
jgi:secondary thiamine-phosphate synthase enzyme